MWQFWKEAIYSYICKYFTTNIIHHTSLIRRLQSMLPKSDSIFPVRNKFIGIWSYTVGQSFVYSWSEKSRNCVWADDVSIKPRCSRILAVGRVDIWYHKWWAWLFLRHIFLYYNELCLLVFQNTSFYLGF
jgi:hypothetical protein